MKDGICPKCGSKEVVGGVSILDQGQYSSGRLSTYIEEDPQAILFKHSKMFHLLAWICGTCGYTELYTSKPEKVIESFKRRIANKKAKQANKK